MTVFDDHVALIRAGDPIDVVARALLALLTPEERLGCLDGDLEFWSGLASMLGGDSGRVPWSGAAIPRLGVPGIQFSDGPRGVKLGAATCFPVAMARGATWDTDLEERVGRAIGEELRAQGGNLFGGVCVNLLRHPKWGRAQETYGEDPSHVGEMGAALARGASGHVMACVKHFALNSMENARFKVDVSADERTLHEVYLPQFRQVIEAGADVVMSAYNSVNGAWCGENRTLLTDILRDEWGFGGIVISDWIAGLRDPVASVKAGLDIEMPFRQQRARALPGALADGRLNWSDVDDAAARILATQLRHYARLTTPTPPISVVASEEHRALAREAAEKAIVLLRNEPVGPEPALPLDPARLNRLAVVGRLAARPNTGDHGSSDVHPPHVVTPLDGLRAALPEVTIDFEDGSDQEAVRRVVLGADAAIVVVGLTARDEGEYISIGGDPAIQALFPPRPAETEGAALARRAAVAGGQPNVSMGGDRARLGLSERDVELIETVSTVHARTIVVVMGGSAITMEGWRERVPAIVYLCYPGMEGGHALARVLLGAVNPSGHLPFAIPVDEAHLAEFDAEATAVRYDLWHGQWKLDRDGHAPAYPFGFGLSYTTFSLKAISGRRNGRVIELRAELTNTGLVAGATVAQAYAGLPGSRFERPQRRLVTFSRADLRPGERREIEMKIPMERLAVRDSGNWLVEPGDYVFTLAQYAGDPDGESLRLHIDV
jgi:beta-glucosidase